MNTETLGADLAAMTGDDSVKDLSFNLFDLVDMVLERVDQEKLEQDLKAANKALWEEAKVKKSGTRTLDLNGTETKTAAYRVTFPQKALEDYADALVEVMSAISYYDLYEDIYRSMGMPQDQIDEIMDALEELDPYGALADDLKDAIDETGDLELEVCLSGGHVSALLYEGEIDGTDLSLALYLGGGEAYVDDLSLELEVDGEAITVKSTGDHGGKSGVFTDKTTIKGDPLRAASLTSITSEPRYEPKNPAAISAGSWPSPARAPWTCQARWPWKPIISCWTWTASPSRWWGWRCAPWPSSTMWTAIPARRLSRTPS